MDKVEKAVIDLNGEWPDDRFRGILSWNTDGHEGDKCGFSAYITFTPGFPRNQELVCTHSEFMEARKRLENKPSWDEHEYENVVQNDNGSWWGIDGCPKPTIRGTWKNERVGDHTEFLCEGHVFGDWRQTLERRPESNPEPEWVPGDMCRIEEWKSSGEWVLCDFDYRIDYIGKSHVVATTVGTPREVERVFKEVRFLPLKSHKERVVEAAMDAAPPRGRDGYRGAYGALYDAGMLKLPEDSQ